jgi:hypothetical protein
MLRLIAAFRIGKVVSRFRDNGTRIHTMRAIL